MLGGCVAGIPLGWLLAYLAFLPAYLGLFFFTLLGLVVGAVMYRLGKGAAPLARRPLWLAGIVVTLVVWGIGLAAEYHDFAGNVEEKIRRSFPRVLETHERRQIHETVRRHVPAAIKKACPPGGFIGYLRWAATDGIMKCPRVLNNSLYTVKLPQRRLIWLIRVLLSLVLLGGAILSQVLGLAKTPGGAPPGDERHQPDSDAQGAGSATSATSAEE